jgi:hypothetical protein
MQPTYFKTPNQAQSEGDLWHRAEERDSEFSFLKG